MFKWTKEVDGGKDELKLVSVILHTVPVEGDFVVDIVPLVEAFMVVVVAKLQDQWLTKWRYFNEKAVSCNPCGMEMWHTK